MNANENTTTPTDALTSLLTNIKSGTGLDALPSIFDGAVSAIITVDKEKKVKLVIAGIDAFTTAQRTLKSIKPDQQSFDEGGKTVSETYSKAKVEERKKTLSMIDKIQKAFAAAEKGDFSQLSNLPKPGQPTKEDASAEQAAS